MNKKGMEMLAALDGADDEMLKDAMPPGMGTYKVKPRSRRFSGFFERPWVAAVITATVALVVLTGVILAGRQGSTDPLGPAGNPQDSREATQKPIDYNNPPVPDDAKMVVSSGGYTIAPTENIQWTTAWDEATHQMVTTYGKDLWANNGEDEVETKPSGLWEDTWPIVPYADDFSLTFDESLALQYAEAYFPNLVFAGSCTLDGTPYTVKDLLADLVEGTYYVVVTAYDEGTLIEGEGREGTMYQFIFRVDMLGDGTNPYAPLEPLDVEVYAGVGEDRVLLKPYLLVHTRYDEEAGEEYSEDRRGYAPDLILPEISASLPVLTYTDAFTVTIKDVDGYGQYNGFMVYDEAYQEVVDGTWMRVEEMPSLPAGQYYLVVDTRQRGQTYLEDYMGDELLEKEEIGWYSYCFSMIVPEGEEARVIFTYEMKELPPIEPVYAKVMVESEGETICLRPYCAGSKRFDDELGKWVHDNSSSSGLDAVIRKEYTRLPVVVYSEVYAKEPILKIEPIDGEYTSIDSIRVYDEAFNIAVENRFVDESLSPLGSLSAGTYYVIVRIDHMGREVGYKQHESGNYEYGFTLVVPEQAS